VNYRCRIHFVNEINFFLLQIYLFFTIEQVGLLNFSLFSNNQVAIGDQSTNGYIKVYNQNFELVHSFKAHTNRINHIKQSPFSKNDLVATCSDDSTVKIWNSTSDWTLIQTFNHSNIANTIEWVNEDTLASGSFDETVQIWSIKTGQTLRTIEVNGYVISLKLLIGCVHVAVGLSNGNINIYNVNDGSLVSTLGGHSSFVQDMVLISSDLLVSSSQDLTIRIWNLKTNQSKILDKHSEAVFGLKLVTSDLLASVSWDQTIKLWNISSGTLLRTLEGHTDLMLWSVDLLTGDVNNTNNHSIMLISGSWDQTIKLWDWQTGECLNEFNANMEIRSLTVLNPSISTQTKSKKNCLYFLKMLDLY